MTDKELYIASLGVVQILSRNNVVSAGPGQRVADVSHHRIMRGH